MIEVKEARTATPNLSTTPDLSGVATSVPAFARLGNQLIEDAQQQTENHFRSYGFLENPAAQFLLLAITERIILTNNARSSGHINQEEAIAQRLLASDMLLLLGGVAHRYYMFNRDKISPSLTLSEEEIQEAHFDFINPKLSRQLHAKLAAIKYTLPESSLPVAEQPYRITVLNVLSQPGSKSGAEVNADQLNKNTEQFQARFGGQGFCGSAWTIKLGDMSLAVFPIDTARAILDGKHPEKLTHEFLHTQYPLNTVGLGFFMLFVEEARVKRLAGDDRSYPDIDSFAYSLRQMTGMDLMTSAATVSPDGSSNFLIQSARTIGTQRTLELATVLPDAYRNADTPLPINISSRLGNAPGILRRIQVTQNQSSRLAA